MMGRHVLHTGDAGSASILKVVTNYLATANLVSISEALVTTKAAGLDLATAYEAIRISSGNSFVHETESQVILNGSRDINFTMDLVVKDISLFQEVAEREEVPLELSPLLIKIFRDAEQRYGPREWSPNVIRRLEDATGLDIRANGFPAQIIDQEPEALGQEVVAARDWTYLRPPTNASRLGACLAGYPKALSASYLRSRSSPAARRTRVRSAATPAGVPFLSTP